jgi:hypothetical protein
MTLLPTARRGCNGSRIREKPRSKNLATIESVRVFGAEEEEHLTSILLDILQYDTVRARPLVPPQSLHSQHRAY